jgi:hypothetical protein
VTCWKCGKCAPGNPRIVRKLEKAWCLFCGVMIKNRGGAIEGRETK